MKKTILLGLFLMQFTLQAQESEAKAAIISFLKDSTQKTHSK